MARVPVDPPARPTPRPRRPAPPGAATTDGSLAAPPRGPGVEKPVLSHKAQLRLWLMPFIERLQTLEYALMLAPLRRPIPFDEQEVRDEWKVIQADLKERANERKENVLAEMLATLRAGVSSAMEGSIKFHNGQPLVYQGNVVRERDHQAVARYLSLFADMTGLKQMRVKIDAPVIVEHTAGQTLQRVLEGMSTDRMQALVREQEEIEARLAEEKAPRH